VSGNSFEVFGGDSSLQSSRLDVGPLTGRFVLNDDRVTPGDGTGKIIDWV
jgi:hypothetical protein